MPLLPLSAVEAATRHVRSLLDHVVVHTPAHAALVVHDHGCALARTLAEAYRRNLPDGQFVDFDSIAPDELHAAFRALRPGDLVVLVQSTNFRLDAFRIRVELFKLGLKVVEHVHLSRMPGVQGEYYIDALAYDPAYYRGVGRALKERIDRAAQAVVDSGAGSLLVFDGGLEAAKLNIGDYSGMNNVGGQFPIGEVFTEARDLEAVNGEVRIHVFGDATYRVNRPDTPITLIVERGRVIGTRAATPAFDALLEQIRRDEGEVWIRELGFGMNRAFTRERRVDDIGTYERMCGIHLSLGAKHGVYPKPGFKRKDARYHIDVFAITQDVRLDGVSVFDGARWVIPADAG
ncbi:MAG: hypothetical protein ACXU8N_12905 [Telluria sp.]